MTEEVDDQSNTAADSAANPPEPQGEAAEPQTQAIEPQAESAEPQANSAEAQDGPVQDPEDGEQTIEQAEQEAAQSDIDLGVLEALLFSTHHPLTGARLAELLEVPSQKSLRKAIKLLNQRYEAGQHSFRIEQVAGGYQLMTLPEYGDYLNRLHQREIDSKLTKAALETLAIIAYKQPILRADVEAIRGVSCGETVRSLMEKHLVKIAGRAELPGRPILYGTTKRFLEVFGLNSIKDLPQAEELNKPKSAPKPKAEPKAEDQKPEEPKAQEPPAAPAEPAADQPSESPAPSAEPKE